MLQFLATALPSIVLVYIFYTFDYFPEPKKLVIYTFFWGIFICFPAGYLNNFFIDYIDNNYIIGSEAHSFFSYLIPGATIEEILKFLVLFFFCRKLKDFDEPIDGLVYGAAVALGFAMYENFGYVYNQDFLLFYNWEQIAIIRAFLTVPMHGFCGMFIGFSIAYYSFYKKNILAIPIGLILAISFHALFNANTGTYISGLIVFIQAILALIVFKILRKKQIQKLNIFNKENFLKK